jgi:hypothetical protein
MSCKKALEMVIFLETSPPGRVAEWCSLDQDSREKMLEVVGFIYEQMLST